MNNHRQQNGLALLLILLAVGVQNIGAFENHRLHVKSVHSVAELQTLAGQGHSSARRLAELIANSPLSGNILPLGIYWAPVWVGTPLQGPFQLAVDTGSTDLMLPAAGCQGCVTNVTGVYAPGKSATYTPLNCTTKLVLCRDCRVFDSSGACMFRNTYETCDLSEPTKPCTIEGPLVQDVAGFVPQSASLATTVLGAIANQSADFQQLQFIDGIVGFSFPGSSAFRYRSLLDSLYLAGVYPANVFAMCLTPNAGGVLTVGGYDAGFIVDGSAHAIPWTPLVSTSAFVVRLEAVFVDYRSVAGSSVTEIIVDSGTNLLLLDNVRYAAVQSAIQSQMCESRAAPPGVCSGALFAGQCFAYTAAQIKEFPVVSLGVYSGYNLPLVYLDLEPIQYLIAPNATSSLRCYGIANTGNSFNIIGDIIMQNYYTIFDATNYRIGWPDVSNCALPTPE